MFLFCSIPFFRFRAFCAKLIQSSTDDISFAKEDSSSDAYKIQMLNCSGSVLSTKYIIAQRREDAQYVPQLYFLKSAEDVGWVRTEEQPNH